MELPGKWTSDAADITREEGKREQSPCSFFCSQGWALVLAARYFGDQRLLAGSRGAVANKHRHRIHLALFGQMMAAIEFLFKDFIALVIDRVTIYDQAVQTAKWIQVDASRVLSFRSTSSTPGSILLHSTSGWFDPATVNERYSYLFNRAPIRTSEFSDLERLWILRHSVAHNAGFVAAHDAVRGEMPGLAGGVAGIDAAFVEESFEFLCEIAKRMAAEVGDHVLLGWLKTRVPAGADYSRDRTTYAALKHIATCVSSRVQGLPAVSDSQYLTDFGRASTS